MKRLLTLILAAALALSLVACGGGNGTPSGGGNDNTTPDTQGTQTPQQGDTSTLPEDETLKATIITNEGDTVEMTAEELIAAYDSNEARFKKLYEYAEIQFIGTIDYIKTDTSVLVEDGHVTAGQQKIVFKEGWCLVIGEDNTRYDLADYDSGDVVKVTTSIFGSPYDTEFLQQTHDNNRVVWLVGDDKIHFDQYSSITTTITHYDIESAN